MTINVKHTHSTPSTVELYCTNVDHIYTPGAEMPASRLCGIATVVAVIAACSPSPASVAAVTVMVYSLPAARPWKVWFKATPARRTS